MEVKCSLGRFSCFPAWQGRQDGVSYVLPAIGQAADAAAVVVIHGTVMRQAIPTAGMMEKEKSTIRVRRGESDSQVQKERGLKSKSGARVCKKMSKLFADFQP